MGTKHNNDTENLTLFKESLETGYLSEHVYFKLVKQELPKKHKLVEKKEKKISIIIPTYNRHNQLCECIDSIINQNYNNYEIIIVDDCSKDNTQEIITSKYTDSRIRFFKNPTNSGAGYSRKYGYNVSDGDFVIFMDDDDYFFDSEYFSLLNEVFDNSDISVVCSNSYMKYEDINLYKFNPLNINDMPCFKYIEKFMIGYNKPYSTFTAAFRKSSLESANFNEMEMVNDAAIYMRGLLNEGNVYVNKKIIGVYRIHSVNISFNIKPKFLIENLEEKRAVYNILAKNKIFPKPESWLKEQVEVTLKYYIDGSRPNKKALNEVLHWVKREVKNSQYLIFKVHLFNLKTKVKKILKSGGN